MQVLHTGSIVMTNAVGFLLARGWDIWREKKQGDRIRRMLRDEQQRNLDDLERWLKAVKRKDFPKSFPAQSNIVWQTHLPMLYLLEEEEFTRAHSFVMERHTLR
jgi:hypothetical protein